MVIEASLRLARDNLVVALIARIIGRNKSEIGKYFLITKYFIGLHEFFLFKPHSLGFFRL